MAEYRLTKMQRVNVDFQILGTDEHTGFTVTLMENDTPAMVVVALQSIVHKVRAMYIEEGK